MRPLLLVLLLCLGVAAQADSQPVAFTQDQLSRFVQADQAVQQVRVRYLAVLLKDQQDKRDSKWSQAAMQIDMAKAIKTTGLSLDDYNRIAHAVATDEALRQRIEALEAPAP